MWRSCSRILQLSLTLNIKDLLNITSLFLHCRIINHVQLGLVAITIIVHISYFMKCTINHQLHEIILMRYKPLFCYTKIFKDNNILINLYTYYYNNITILWAQNNKKYDARVNVAGQVSYTIILAKRPYSTQILTSSMYAVGLWCLPSVSIPLRHDWGCSVWQMIGKTRPWNTRNISLKSLRVEMLRLVSLHVRCGLSQSRTESCHGL